MTPNIQFPQGMIFRISQSASDFILFVQLGSLTAKFFWYIFNYQQDWLGFVIIVGSVATFIAYFNFFLFGFFVYLWKWPAAFWHTLHPLNFAIGLIFVSLSIATPELMGNMYGLIVVAVVSACIAFIVCPWVLMYPRVAIIMSAVSLIISRALPRAFAHYTITIAGVFLVFITLAIYIKYTRTKATS